MEAMAVDCYMPRLQLPGAPVSQQCLMSELSVEQAVAPVMPSAPVDVGAVVAQAVTRAIVVPEGAQSASVNKPVSGGAAVMRALFDDESKPAQAIKAANAPDGQTCPSTKTEVPTAQRLVPEFALSIIRGSNILLIDDALPESVDSGEYLRLIQNMLFALGAGRQQLAIDAFVWPMIRNSQVDQGDTAARQTLQAFLGKQVEQLTARYVLVMGDAAAHYFIGSSVVAGKLTPHAQLPISWIAIQSASDMLAEPLLKRDVWRDLQPLRQALTTS